MRFKLVFIATVGLLCQQTVCSSWAAKSDAQKSTFKQLDSNGDGLLDSEEIPAEKQLLFARLLRTSDANSDGKLTLQEFDQSLQVNRPEKPLMEKTPARLEGADELLLMLALCDANGDGTITPNEPPQNLKRFYDFLRSRVGSDNKDRINVRQAAQVAPQLARVAREIVKRQQIDIEFEYALLPEKNRRMILNLDGPQRPGQALADPERADELFRRLDANKDGQVEYEEVPEAFADRFDNLLARADLDDDEKISRIELRRISERIRAFNERRERMEEKRKAAKKKAKAKAKKPRAVEPEQKKSGSEPNSKPSAQEADSPGE